jgi:hypothetical protein
MKRIMIAISSLAFSWHRRRTSKAMCIKFIAMAFLIFQTIMAQAELVDMTFNGQVTDVTHNPPATIPVAVGDPVSFKVTYEASTPAASTTTDTFGSTTAQYVFPLGSANASVTVEAKNWQITQQISAYLIYNFYRSTGVQGFICISRSGTMHFGPEANYAPSLSVDFSVTVPTGIANPLLRSGQLPKSTAELGFIPPAGNSGTPDACGGTTAASYVASLRDVTGFFHANIDPTSIQIGPHTTSPLPLPPPPGAAPNPIILLTPYPLDPTKPTVVITHGWQPFSAYNAAAPDWVSQMASRIQSLGANVITPVWRDAFTITGTGSALSGAATQVANQGRLLANGLLTDQSLSSIIRNRAGIHFLGHSLGSLVNAYAANVLTQQGVHVDQFTILDRPFGQGTRPESIRNVIPFDADGPIFRKLLPQGDVTWVDNYFGTDDTIPPATGAGLLPALAFNHPYDGANHTGVHERYYATIPATKPSTATCPVDGGFLCSITGGGFSKRQPFDWNPRRQSNPFSAPAHPLSINPTDWLAHNCQIGNNTAACKEGSPAYLWLPNFQVKANELFLSFDFQWPNTGDGDWLTLHFGDQLLVSFSGAAFKGSDFITAFIPIGQFSGKTNQLLFTLNNAGAPNAEINIRNINLTTFISAPIDIKPGGTPNSINSKSSGKTPVAILSSVAFNAPTDVAPTSLTFGRTGDESSLSLCNQKAEDVNGDRLPDLVCHFDSTNTGFRSGDTEGILKGRTHSGIPIIGTDSVRIVQ